MLMLENPFTFSHSADIVAQYVALTVSLILCPYHTVIAHCELGIPRYKCRARKSLLIYPL